VKKPADVKKDETRGDDMQVTKKRRTTEGGASVATAVVVNIAEGNGGGAERGKNGKPARKVNAPFRRVDPDKVNPTVMMDNRYEVKVCLFSLTLCHRT
jgi:hypothetical protein